MRARVDPQRREIEAIKAVTDWRGRRVLDLGCGGGRLTLRLARLGAKVHAIDPDEESIRKARKELPQSLRGRVRYEVGRAERLRLAEESFDGAIFSWSL
jgi:2-polyprenyl-6-hydroxyphenyl methylase/3-demethylubiquinone-9 3-methyltransferase